MSEKTEYKFDPDWIWLAASVVWVGWMCGAISRFDCYRGEEMACQMVHQEYVDDAVKKAAKAEKK